MNMRKVLTIVLAAGLVLALSGVASGTNNYLKQNNVWRRAATWQNADWPGKPNAGDIAWIGDGKTVTYNHGTTTSVNYVYIGHTSSTNYKGAGTLNMTDGRLNVNTTFHLRHNNRAGTVNQTGGSLYIYSNLNMSVASGTNGWGTYNLNGGDLYVSGNILHSNSDRGRLYIDGGNLNMTGGGYIDVHTLRIGDTGGTTGSFTYGANNVTVTNGMKISGKCS